MSIENPREISVIIMEIGRPSILLYKAAPQCSYWAKIIKRPRGNSSIIMKIGF